jgi:Protein of unknown function (DUF2778)
MKYYYDRYWGVFTTRTPLVGVADLQYAVRGYGYSGNIRCINDPSFQHVKDVGPLPAGMYTIEEVYNDVHRGEHTCLLVPNEANEMCGRSGFLIHGDTTPPEHTASNGCIITPLWVRQQFQAGDVLEVL